LFNAFGVARAKLDKSEADSYEHHAKALENGYVEAYVDTPDLLTLKLTPGSSLMRR
jgi:hypothetical protein